MPRRLVLVLDDIRTFTPPDDCELIHARTIVHAAVVLSRRSVDFLLLDHDLGPDSAKGLVSFLQMKAAEGIPPQIGTIYIISANPQARVEFPQALELSGYRVEHNADPLKFLDIDETNYWSHVAREVDRACRPY